MSDIFESLKVLHNQETKVLHRDIKPQNVLIDVTGKARLADFGISRRLSREETTLHTRNVGTKYWMAYEAIDEESGHGYKRCSDIQVAGMLMYYALSGGHHPFGNSVRCEINILDGRCSLDHVQDEAAKDLIEWMITREPKDRPTIEQALHHPYFWTKKKMLDYLIMMGNEKEVAQRDKADKDIVVALDLYTTGRAFINWRSKVTKTAHCVA
ncbi:serine/threonine-protein kinase/endoribonuclease IRE1-like [Megalops cyprinoides]|uniref:serine/threonine-protein kinase/endoribonuclease IRE1-like n=1 Tax=Megalops cyprinoides TaxID=118141 RepID=UPI0018655B5A|nr:serine/threonine-protein kinase/endoribonuclease IRE1-like [Megalops cyprinoides]